jgi:hypothetical protein
LLKLKFPISSSKTFVDLMVHFGTFASASKPMDISL